MEKNTNGTYTCSICQQVGHNKRFHKKTHATPHTPHKPTLPPLTNVDEKGGVSDSVKNFHKLSELHNEPLPPSPPHTTLHGLNGSQKNQEEKLTAEKKLLDDMHIVWELSHTVTLPQVKEQPQGWNITISDYEKEDELSKELGTFITKFAETFQPTHLQWMKFFQQNDIPVHIRNNTMQHLHGNTKDMSDALVGMLLASEREHQKGVIEVSALVTTKMSIAEAHHAPPQLLDGFFCEIKTGNFNNDSSQNHATQTSSALSHTEIGTLSSLSLNPHTPLKTLNAMIDWLNPNRHSSSLCSALLTNIAKRDDLPDETLHKIVDKATSSSALLEVAKKPHLPESVTLAVINKKHTATTYLIVELVENQKTLTPKVLTEIEKYHKVHTSALIREALKVRQKSKKHT